MAVWGGPRPWRIGIQDPFDRGAVRGVVELTEGAVATSGRYERGDHIRRPADHPGDRTSGSLASVTVVGPDLGLADAYSTAAFVDGFAALEWLAELPGYGAHLIATDGTTRSLGLELSR